MDETKRVLDDFHLHLVGLAIEAKRLTDIAGAFRVGQAFKPLSGDSDSMVKALDTLSELGLINKLTGQEVKRTQDQIYVWVRF